MNTQIRDLIADALYPNSAYKLPAICERYGMEPGTSDEAFGGKIRYVMRRLDRLANDRVLEIARKVLVDYPNDKLRVAIEAIDLENRRVSSITRNNIAKALDRFSLGNNDNREEFLRKFWPKDGNEILFASLLGTRNRPYVGPFDSTRKNSDVLSRIGFSTASQGKLFKFLEDLVHPERIWAKDREKMVAAINPILERDGYQLVKDGHVSGYPTYKVMDVAERGSLPADNIISQTLLSFDERGVHQAWGKALERRSNDPDGAITAARSLLETVCKHIIEEAGGKYGPGDDLPKLYNTAAEFLNLAPSQHAEPVFKQILGNVHSVVSNLAGLRNKLGDSHGQGKLHVKPLPRHAELAVNLAGSAAMFLISTWNARQAERSPQP